MYYAISLLAHKNALRDALAMTWFDKDKKVRDELTYIPVFCRDSNFCDNKVCQVTRQLVRKKFAAGITGAVSRA